MYIFRPNTPIHLIIRADPRWPYWSEPRRLWRLFIIIIYSDIVHISNNDEKVTITLCLRDTSPTNNTHTTHNPHNKHNTHTQHTHTQHTHHTQQTQHTHHTQPTQQTQYTHTHNTTHTTPHTKHTHNTHTHTIHTHTTHNKHNTHHTHRPARRGVYLMTDDSVPTLCPQVYKHFLKSNLRV